VRRFAQPVTINTLRNWGTHEGCPLPRIYSHGGDRINIGRSEYSSVVVSIPPNLRSRIGAIEFWAELPRRGG